MKFQEMAEKTDGLKWLTQAQGKVLYDLILQRNITNILELGFYHGVSTLYMAGALHEKGSDGRITTIDKIKISDLTPSLTQLAMELQLDSYIHPIYSETDYTWELQKLLTKIPRPHYDLVFIDGSHLWKTDALAFFLCDKMLSKGGIIIFDDLSWTIANDTDPENSSWTRKFSAEERSTPQIQKIFDLLVKEHPSYGEFREEDGFGFATKLLDDNVNLPKETTIVKPVMVTKEMWEKMILNQRK